MAEPAPSYVEEIAATAERPLLILCDHAGKEVPGGLGLLGIDAAALSGHIGWDIGAADLTRALARRLGAAAVLDHCSRLVIDPNRRAGSATSVPAARRDCGLPPPLRPARSRSSPQPGPGPRRIFASAPAATSSPPTARCRAGSPPSAARAEIPPSFPSTASPRA